MLSRFRMSLGRFSVLSLFLSTFVCAFVGSAFAKGAPDAPRFVAPRFIEPKADEPKANEGSAEEKTPSASEKSAEEMESVELEDETPTLDSSDSPKESNEVDDETLGALSLSEDLELDDESIEESDDVDSEEISAADDQAPGEKEPYDVYKENGRYFVGWEKPELAIVFTGMTNGYIEPCGCAGMDRMKGGLSRRCTFLSQIRNEFGWETVAVDTGQITVGFGVQEEMKFDMAMNAFQLMQYDAIGIGKGELRFPAYFLLTFTAPTASAQSLFTSANVGVYGYHPTYTLPYKIVERGGKRIGIVSVVCEDEATGRRDESILLESPEEKLAEVAPRLKKEKCDVSILIVHGTEAETASLAKAFPSFNYVVTADTPSEPPAEVKKLNKKQSLIEVGEKGKFAVVVGIYKDGSTRYQRVALDSRYESSPEITLLMKDYQTILKNLITTKGFKGGLGINPARSPMSETLGKYVGSAKCQSCHEDAYRVWLRSGHANAWNSLKETANPPRDFDPECIGCHVIGWDGLQRFPYVDGYSSEKKTPNLLNVGCESCHGPGEKHIAAETGDDEATQEKLRLSMRLGDNVKKVCYSCHDGDNSPEFEFDSYYPQIEHKESLDEE